MERAEEVSYRHTNLCFQNCDLVSSDVSCLKNITALVEVAIRLDTGKTLESILEASRSSIESLNQLVIEENEEMIVKV